MCAKSAATTTRRPDVTLRGFHDNSVRKKRRVLINYGCQEEFKHDISIE